MLSAPSAAIALPPSKSFWKLLCTSSGEQDRVTAYWDLQGRRGEMASFFPKMRRIENSWVDTRASWFNLTHTWLFEDGWSDYECVCRVLLNSFYTFPPLFASCLKQVSSGWSVKMPLCFSISSALCIWTDVYMRPPPERAERIRVYKVRFPWWQEREDDEYPLLPPLKCQTCLSSLTSELSFSLSHFLRHIDTPVMSALKYMRLTSVDLSYNVLCI